MLQDKTSPESWSDAVRLATNVSPSVIGKVSVEVMTGASLASTMVMLCSKSRKADPPESVARTITMYELSAFESVGDSKFGAETKVRTPLLAFTSNFTRSKEFDTAGREKSMVPESVASVALALTSVTYCEFSTKDREPLVVK